MCGDAFFSILKRTGVNRVSHSLFICIMCSSASCQVNAYKMFFTCDGAESVFYKIRSNLNIENVMQKFSTKMPHFIGVVSSDFRFFYLSIVNWFLDVGLHWHSFHFIHVYDSFSYHHYFRMLRSSFHLDITLEPFRDERDERTP